MCAVGDPSGNSTGEMRRETYSSEMVFLLQSFAVLNEIWSKQVS